MSAPKRHLQTTQQHLRETARSVSQPITRQAFLQDRYPGYATKIAVSLSDPRLGPLGIIVSADVRPGIRISEVPAGSPVLVIIRHGRYEVVGISSNLEA